MTTSHRHSILEEMSDSLSQFQDVLGQMTFLKVYTQLCIGFPIAHSTEDVVAAIQKGAAKLTETFPWLAGQVINEGSGPGNSGLFKIIPYAKHQKSPPVIVKRLPNLDYQDIIEKKAPMSMLDGDILAPRKGIPASYGENEEPAEVFSIQANFIKGGLILTFAGQHNVMDMNGQGHLISLFAKAMRGELFSETEIKEGNRDRRNIISLLKDDEPLLDHSFMQVDPSNAGRLNCILPLGYTFDSQRQAWRHSRRKLNQQSAITEPDLRFPSTTLSLPSSGNAFPQLDWHDFLQTKKQNSREQ